MAARSVTLDPALDAFVAEQIASGAYADEQAMLTAALALLQREQRIEAAKVARFKTLVQEGLDDLDAGCFEIVEDLGAWFDQIEDELDKAADAA